MRKVTKRILSASLAAVMLLSLAGCHGGGQNGQNGQNGHGGGGAAITEDLANPDAAAEHVFAEENVWDLGWNGVQVSIYNDSIAAFYREYQWPDSEEVPVETDAEVDNKVEPAETQDASEGNNEEQEATEPDEGTPAESEAEEPVPEDIEDVDDGTIITDTVAFGKAGDASPKIINLPNPTDDAIPSRIIAGDDSFILVVDHVETSDTGEYKETYTLDEYDLDGNLIKSADIVPSDPNAYFYANTCVRGKDGIVITGDSAAYVFDNDLNKKGEISVGDDAYLENIFALANGDLVALVATYADGVHYTLNTIDMSTGKLGAELDFTVGSNFSIYNASGSRADGYTLEGYDGVNLKGYSASVPEGEIICSLIDSDISPSRLDRICTLSNDHLVSVEHNDDYTDYRIVFYRKVPAEEVAAKEIITLGCVYSDYQILNAVVDYNKKSTQYRIRVVNYSQLNTEDDWDAGSRAFDSDIISGNAPDVVILDWGSNPEKYASKGLFTDLESLMGSNGNITKADILPNIVEISSYDGKLYTIPVSFTVQTYIMDGAIAPEDGIVSIDEIKALEEEYGCLALFQTPAPQVLSTILANSRKKFMDPTTGKCDFNNPEFISILEYVKQYPKSYEEINNEEIDYDEYMNVYRSHKALMGYMGISDFTYLNSNIRQSFDGEYAFVSAPGAEQRGTLSVNSMFAITTQCTHPEGAWDFVSSFLTKEAQDMAPYGMPIRQDSLETRLQDIKKGPYYVENGEKVYYEDSVFIGGEEKKLEPMTDAEIDQVRQLVTSVTQLSYYDEELDNIINEEVSAYLAGQKSAQDVASVIQSRVQIYINEHK